ncbi:MAG: TRAP transporter small permease [Spirochaetia bacterium]|jgi:TRAP-type C4-dicarboxylate transport system permease small subunit|nr:TRAP transporter small permease [Spirochaetia bacterium]
MNKVYRAVCNAEMFIAVLFLVVSVVAMCISAVLRTLDHPIAWGLDIALMLFCWSTFLGTDIAFRNKALVKVDMFVKVLPAKLQKTIDALVYLLMVAAIVFLIVYGTKLAVVSRARVFPSATWLSYSWVTASVPVSMALMLVSALRQIYENFFRTPGKSAAAKRGE